MGGSWDIMVFLVASSDVPCTKYHHDFSRFLLFAQFFANLEKSWWYLVHGTSLEPTKKTRISQLPPMTKRGLSSTFYLSILFPWHGQAEGSFSGNPAKSQLCRCFFFIWDVIP